MGTIFSYVTRKLTSSRIELDSSSSTEEMAEGKARSAARQQFNETRIFSQEEMRRYSTALNDAQEFLSISESIMDRQRVLEAELEKSQERLRRFTEDHARQSESNVENINSANSPSALERNYEQFYDHQRIDAVEAIENLRIHKERSKMTELHDKLVACYIFEESYESALLLKKNFIHCVSLILTSAPAIGAHYYEAARKKGSEVQFSLKLEGHQLRSLDQSSENSLKVILKETAESCDVNALVQRTMVGLGKLQEKGYLTLKEYKQDFLLHPEIKKYIEKCCKYTWKLVCQTPPYLIEGNIAVKKSGTAIAFTPAAHQHCRESAPSTRSSGYIQYVVWPGLFDGSARRVIRKTEVIT